MSKSSNEETGMERCVVCGNAYERAFRVTLADGSSSIFDSFECAIELFAPRCAHCRCRIIGHGVDRGSVIFCCDHCARCASSEELDKAEIDAYPAGDAPAVASSARAFASRSDRALRLQEGAMGWVLMWLLGIPIPLLLLFFLLRGCT